MREHNPDLWQAIVVESKEYGKVYKILASWYGGFLGGDSWRMSSGVESVQFEDDMLVMPQSSGSVYRMHKNNEGMSGFASSVLASYEDSAAKSEGTFTIKAISSQELFAAFA